ncbi:ketopantoate hydroxymethyltransferase [Planifilum fulgidum]|jgi:3-methyl-2-oxobutanoate hydroxymethyltransferase|uniref:3-methyl-2-oxobutanoate hydroxymethyltransferase n=1 Tax=Planifilum fulgidum TaxID=201973 RepID=A0A1I2LF45_9BACL|nr:3-methyl-2-oxobutanoate hydroxymethyltransferase [Planifilum fulgidum]MBO2496461.1 3-methyl-2-oxobutanoate hydroxymethyltransferase [Bacillota bacterium]MBO2531542.1 3-methyl-2-oxobutanoate hydroxymethyltransferase [Thermoactinomycetaceae bacterium]SFF76077.1 ketopantoate hydroxymethyltransferase [Planifilum fulgidum]
MGKSSKVTTRTLSRMKQKGEPIAMLTAYDYPSAKLAEAAGVDVILVGDSLGMVVLGYDSTVPVTLDDMTHHTKAVVRGAERAMVVADLPFLTAHLGKEEVLRAAGRLMQEGGAQGVKMEGGEAIVDAVRACTAAGIPVMGHLGLTPQSVHQLGGYRIQGKDAEMARRILREARMLEEAGIFALVLECVPEELAREITGAVSVPTIGIGAGRHCDGQVLVYHDVLQMASDIRPSFVKTYAEVGKQIVDALRRYVEDVRERRFPEEEHVFHSPEVQAALYGGRGGENG